MTNNIDILSALDHISPDIPRDDWFRVLAGVKTELGDAGEEIARNWSRSGSTYKAADFDATWRSITAGAGITAGTVCHYARESGWRPDKAEPKPTPLRGEADRLRRKRQEEVALECERRWEQANPATGDHPYLQTKAAAPLGIRQEGELLLIPLYDADGKLWSLQTIDPAGKKLFIKDSRTSGAYFRIKGAGPVVVAEGYATASSIHSATGYNVAVSFSCHNLKPVAQAIREKLPDGDIIIAADAEPEATTQKAREVAKLIHARLAVPSMKDFNDLAMEDGFTEVKSQIDAAKIVESDRWSSPEPISETEWNSAGLTPDCIVQDYLYADVAVQVAPGGTGKTTLNLYEAIHIALGLPLYGLEICKPGPVVILTAEDSREMLVARLKRIAEAIPLAPLQIEHVMQRVRIADVSGKGIRLTEVMRETVMPSAFVDELAESLKTLAPVMIMIDPAVSFGVGESRVNDAEQGLIEAGRRLRRALGCCIRYTHHTGKGNARAGSKDQYTGRGGSAFADGARMVHVIQPVDAAEWEKRTGKILAPGDNCMVIARSKMSYCPPQEEILLLRTGYRFEYAEETEANPIAILKRDSATLLDTITKLQDEKPTKNMLENSDIGMPRARLRAALTHLTETGQVERVANTKKGGPQEYLRATGEPNGEASCDD